MSANNLKDGQQSCGRGDKEDCPLSGVRKNEHINNWRKTEGSYSIAAWNIGEVKDHITPRFFFFPFFCNDM